MPTARKYAANRRSMSDAARKRAYGSLSINWWNMRPDLHLESKETTREEMLAWIASFLGLPKLDSRKDLTDGQIGLVLDEMRRLTGKPKVPTAPPRASGNVVNIAEFRRLKSAPAPDEATAETIHLTSDEQFHTLEKLVSFIGWNERATANFLTKRKFAPTLRMQTFEAANRLTMILLNIAADKDLRAAGATKISRPMTAKHIPTIKRKLGIGQ